MKFLNNKAVMFTILIFFIPIFIKSHSLKLAYEISGVKKEIKKLEMENQYLKKNYYSISSLSKIRKEALDMGFKTPEPYTIVILNNSSKKDSEKSANLFARITKNLIKSDNL